MSLQIGQGIVHRPTIDAGREERFCNLQHHLLAALATLLVAGSFLATERIASITNPMSLTLLRFVGAIMILAPYVLRRSVDRRQVVRLLPRGLVMGFFYAAFFVCFFHSLEKTTTLNTSSIYTLAPFMTALFSLLVFGDRISRRMLFGYVLGVVGTLWIIFQGSFDQLAVFNLNSGDLVFTLGMLWMCCFTISMKLYACQQCDPFVLVFTVLLGGSLWMSLALAVMDQPLGWGVITFDAYLNIAYLVLFATIATVYLYQRATVALGPGKVMAYGYLTPAIVAFLQLFFHGETISAIIWPGILTSVAATIILETN